MITIKRLSVPALKHLRDIDLWLPRRGATLIEGPNESGKSTLFEAIYFALYGRPIVGEETRPTLASLIPHDRAQAQVAVTVISGETELAVTRTLTRGRNGSVTSEATLVVRQPNKPEERISSVAAVNDRILAELRGLDGDALRNSCFMEQKGLERLETLRRDEREEAIARLLGLEHLVNLEHALAPSVDDRRQLDMLRAQERVARQRRLTREASEREGDVSQRLQAAELRELLDSRDTLVSRLERLAERDQRLQEELRENDAALAQVDGLHSAMRRLSETERLRYRVRVAANETTMLTSRLEEIDAIALAQAPEARRRLEDIERIEAALREVEGERTLLNETQSILQRVQRADGAARQAQIALAEAERARSAASTTLAKAQARDTMAAWILARQRADVREGRTQQLAALSVERGNHERGMTETRTQAWQWLALTAAAAAMTALSAWLALALKLGPLWGIVGMALLATFALGLRWQREVTSSRKHAWRISQAEHGITSVHAEANLVRRLVNDDIGRLESQLRIAGMPVPETAEDGERILNQLPIVSGSGEMEAQVRAAETQAARARVDLERAQRDAESAYMSLRSLGYEGESTDIARRITGATSRAAALVEEAHALGLPDDVAGLAAARGRAEVTVTMLLSNASGRDEAQARLRDTAESLDDIMRVWAGELRTVASDLASLGLIDDVAMPDPLESSALDMLHVELGEQTQRLLAQVDEQAAREKQTALLAERKRLAADADDLRVKRQAAQNAIHDCLSARGVVAQGDEPLDTMTQLWPLLGEVTAEEVEQLRSDRETARMHSYHSEQTVAEHERETLLDSTPLDEAALRERLAIAERELRLRAIASEIAGEARARIIRRALPETEVYMRALLPELTAGRYHDITLLRDETQTGALDTDLAIRMWDDQAGRYVRKNLFSGGTRDQASLALRLAFALATLPKELGATPGFIFLDEPLSAFDNERSLALARVLTSGAIAQAFAQVFLISHSQVIEPSSFDYTLRMDNGRVAASTLPTGALAEALWEAEATVTTDSQAPRAISAKSRGASGGASGGAA